MPKYKRKIELQERIKDVKHLPILYIYSESDTWVPISMGKILQENTSIPTQFWIAKDAKHADIIKSSDKEIYQKQILAFYDQEVVKYNAEWTKNINKVHV